MRFPFVRLRTAFSHVGSILVVFAALLLVPLILSFGYGGWTGLDVPVGTYAIPIVISLVVGGLCWQHVRQPRSRRRLSTLDAMLICLFSWVMVSAVGAIPLAYGLKGVGYLDAYFEAMSGFTTTGITMLTGLDDMPKSLLFWRSMTQWVGGLGILTFFLVVVYQGGLSHALFSAESHKISGKRIAPGMWHTLKILWLIYGFYTFLIAVGLFLSGTSVYDAISHAFTCLSTGGYSPYDASIAYYESDPSVHHLAIEYILIFGMWAGGTNFLIHYRLLTGKIKSLWDNDEMRMWWVILGGSLAVVLLSRLHAVRDAALGESFRHSLFQVMSIATTTGFGTRDIGGDYFHPAARIVFLVLMFIGGCAGSTGGGLKVIRIVILWKLMIRQMRRAVSPPSAVNLLLVDRKKVDRNEAYRTAALLFAWVFLLLTGSLTTAALSSHGALASSSGMFSALGNIGPCYISVQGMTELHPGIKLMYILGMLAGRLEIVPLLVLFSRRAWH